MRPKSVLHRSWLVMWTYDTTIRFVHNLARHSIDGGVV
jgi:hypothetical protein